jgi:hypothetical protein
MRAVLPDLIEVLEAPPNIDAREKDYLIATLLDALVEAAETPGPDSQVPAPNPTTLALLFEQWPTQTLILFGRIGAERDGMLLNLLPLSSGQTWFGIANLLLARKPVPGFAAEVLHGVKLNLEIAVMDPNAGIGGGTRGGVYNERHPDFDQWRPRSYPPEVVYEFAGNISGAVVLSTGPRPVYYLRRISTGPVVRRYPPLRGGPDASARLDYVNAILGPWYHPVLRDRMLATIEWRDEQTLLTEVERERSLIEQGYQGMLDLLISQGHLTTREAGDVPLQLNVQIVDHRASPSSPLPLIPLTR